MVYKIAICDDQEVDAQYIHAMVQSFANVQNIRIHVDLFPSAEAFLFSYAEDKSYDMLLLDIEMGELNGVELAKQIRSENKQVQILFITGYPSFMAEGYEVSALHYLLKPVISEKLHEVLQKAINNMQQQEKHLLFMIDGEARKIQVGDILYIEAFAHSCTFTTIKGTFEVKVGIAEMETQLTEGFIRCHRSFIVGLKHINCIAKATITLDNGVVLPLSRRKYDAANQAFINYFRGEANGNHECSFW